MNNEVDAVKSVEGYKPSSEFEVDKRALLTDISLSDSAELWLIQWPANQAPEFDGQEISLQLNSDGLLGSFQGSSGKSYDVVSCVGQEPEASVFLPSSSDARIIGKISRRVSLVHFPEPEELEMATPMKSAFQKSSTTTSRGFSSSRRTNSSRSSKPRSSVAEFEGPSKQSSIKQEPEPSESRDYLKRHSKKSKQKHEASRSTDHSTQDSGRGHSAVTLSGSPGRSSEGKTRKQKK